jgi:hypothetical protein
MSKLARTLILGATLAAMNLAGTTAVAQAHTNDDPASKRHRALGQAQLGVAGDYDAPRPPLERQVGESYRYYHDALAGQAQTTQADAVQRFRRGERASQEQPADAATRAALAQEQSYSFYSSRWTPANKAPAPVRPAQPSGQPDWLAPAIGVLAAALALSGGLAVTITRRARRRVRAGQAA